MSQDPRQERVDRYLRRLPTELPAPGLGERIVDRHLARRRRRRIVPLAAAACLLAGFLAWRAGTPDAEIAQVSVRPAAALVDVRSVDRRLQAAYLAGAGEAELASLWQAREQAVAELRSTPEPVERRQVRL